MTGTDEPAAPANDEHPEPSAAKRAQVTARVGVGQRLGSFGRRWSEHFTLRRAQSISKALSEAERLRLFRIASIVTQKKEAAEALWYTGHRAEGLRLLREASEWSRQSESVAGPLPRELDQDGSNDSRVWADSQPDPADVVLDGEIDRDGELAFHRLLSGVESVQRVITQAADPPKRLALRRWTRTLGVATTLLLAATAVAFWFYEPPHFEATATSQQPEWPARFAIDGDRETEWQGHDRARPTLDLELIPPRNVTAVHLLNGHNRWFNDRAVARYRLELRRKGEVVAAVPGEFAELTASPEWVIHEVEAREADHLRLTVLSYHGAGSALAELRIIEATSPPAD